MNITELSVRRPVTILVLTLLISGLAAFIVREVAVDLYPAVSFPTISITTTYEGADPQEVEEGVTRIIEKGVSRISGLENLTSVSSGERSRITLEFGYDKDLDEATGEVREALDKVRNTLPREADSPIIAKFNLSDLSMMTLILKGTRPVDQMLRTAEDEVLPKLERIEGISSVGLNGGVEQMVLVNVLQSRLDAYNLNLTEVTRALSDRNLQAGTGTLNRDGLDYTLRVDERYEELEDIRRTVVTTLRSGELDMGQSVNRSRIVRLEDIAEVSLALDDKSGRVYVNGSPAIILSIFKETDSNTIQVADAVKGALARIDDSLPEGVALDLLYDSTKIIDSTMQQVYSAALQGGLLAMLVLFLFLRSLKSTLIIGLSIPISLLVTIMAMRFMGLTLNLLSLTGLILGLGMIVDNSIVILENIYRYRERGAKLNPAAILGSREMVSAIMASTLTTLCVFIPMIIWKDDLQFFGQILEDLIFTVVISIIVSLLTAVTLVPALSSHFLKLDTRKQKPLKNRFLILLDGLIERMLTGLERQYKKALEFSLQNRALVLTFVFVLFLFSMKMFGTLGINLQPQQNIDDKLRIDLTMPTGTDLEGTEDVLNAVRRMVEEDAEGIKELVVSIGSSSGSSHKGYIDILLPQPKEQVFTPSDIKDVLQPQLNQFPGAVFKMSTGRGLNSGAPVDIRILSDDLTLAGETALQVRDLLRDLPGIVNPLSSMEGGAPEFRIDIDTDRAAALGLSIQEITAVLKELINGRYATTYWHNGKELDVKVLLREEDRNSLPDLQSQYIRTPSGERISIANLVELKKTTGPESIDREDEQRVVHVTAELSPGTAVSDVQSSIDGVLESYSPPEGVEIDMAGESQEVAELLIPVIVVLVIAVIMVFAVMASQFESLVDPFIIFVSIPLLLIGVVWVYVFTGESFSMLSAIGVIILTGIVVNNGIVLVDYTNLLQRRGEDLLSAVANGAVSRLRPILMTSLTTILGMVPMGFFPGEGTEFIRPIGQTVVGGLTVSTFITLFVTPVIYSLLNKKREKRPGLLQILRKKKNASEGASL